MEHLWFAFGPAISLPFVCDECKLAFVVWSFLTYAIIERSTGNVSEMSEAVPLRARLGVHMIHIIIGNTLSQRLDLMLKNLTTKRGNIRHVERQATSQSAITH